MNYFKKSIQSGLDEYYQILKTVLSTLNNSELFWRPSLQSNNIIFLVWHMGLVEDNLTNKILCKKYKTLCLINDCADSNILNNCDGVHLGQKDISNQKIKRILAKKKFFLKIRSLMIYVKKFNQKLFDYFFFI